MATPSAAGASLQKASRLRQRLRLRHAWQSKDCHGYCRGAQQGGALGRSATPSRPFFWRWRPPTPPTIAPAPFGRYAQKVCAPGVRGVRPSAFPARLFAHSPSPLSPRRCASVPGPVRGGAPAATEGPLRQPPASKLPPVCGLSPCVGWSPSAAAAGFGSVVPGGRRLPLACPLRGFGSLRLQPRGR